MRYARFSKAMIACLCLFLLLSCSGVYATWMYAEMPLYQQQAAMPLAMNSFEYAPQDIVPGGSIDAPVGENHLALIEKILNEASYGLNATKKPIIHNVLESPGDVIYCSQNVQGGNLKHLMIDGVSAANKLYFVITKISDTEYHTFTFLYSDLNYIAGTEIPVYKTLMIKGENGVWTAPRSYRGYAKINNPKQVSKGIDVTSYRDN